ncbi:MAG: hypothetical protein MH825_04205 [Cyanobacteria bacterium]|nr:hypothetical protein [Cyanobacteriota bacterium]
MPLLSNASPVQCHPTARAIATAVTPIALLVAFPKLMENPSLIRSPTARLHGRS